MQQDNAAGAEDARLIENILNVFVQPDSGK